MKTLIISLKILKKHPVVNILIVAELAAVMVVTAVMLDSVRISTNSIRTLRNSLDRVVYCSDPNDFYSGSISDDSSDAEYDGIDKAINRKFENIKKEYPCVRGFSRWENSFVTLDAESLKTWKIRKDSYADVLAVDNETLRAIRYPLESGDYITPNKTGGAVPAIIGGQYAGKYCIGQKLKVYTFADESGKKIKSIEITVRGKLEKPEQVLTTAHSTNVKLYPVSNLYISEFGSPLILIIPKNLVGYMPSTGENSANVYLYLDRSATKSQINAVRHKLTYDYTLLDSELIEGEKLNLSKTFAAYLPFIIMLLIVSLFGVVTMCMLTTLRNMKTFSLYYLTGCTRLRTAAATALYSLFYFLGSALIFCAAMKILYIRNSYDGAGMNFALYPKTVLTIFAILAAICLISLVIPFLILRRQSTLRLLRAD